MKYEAFIVETTYEVNIVASFIMRMFSFSRVASTPGSPATKYRALWIANPSAVRWYWSRNNWFSLSIISNADRVWVIWRNNSGAESTPTVVFLSNNIYIFMTEILNKLSMSPSSADSSLFSDSLISEPTYSTSSIECKPRCSLKCLLALNSALLLVFVAVTAIWNSYSNKFTIWRRVKQIFMPNASMC